MCGCADRRSDGRVGDARIGARGIVQGVTALPGAPGRTRRRLPALLVPTLLLAACTATYGSSAPAQPPAATPAPPPPPPAACLLDTDALAAATGLTWTADATTASDSRCVYDPAVNAPATGAAPPPPKGLTGEFVAVDVAAASDQPPAAQLDVLAGVCDEGTRTPTARDGFVCRFGEGSVFGGLVRGDQMITVAASAVPPGTTAAALVTAFGQQLDALG